MLKWIVVLFKEKPDDRSPGFAFLFGLPNQ